VIQAAACSCPSISPLRFYFILAPPPPPLSAHPLVCHAGSRALLPLEIGPQLKYILRPAIKMQNMHLMTPQEKARLEAHANIMALMQLVFRERGERGKGGGGR
jgi:hypothetical protein